AALVAVAPDILNIPGQVDLILAVLGKGVVGEGAVEGGQSVNIGWRLRAEQLPFIQGSGRQTVLENSGTAQVIYLAIGAGDTCAQTATRKEDRDEWSAAGVIGVW